MDDPHETRLGSEARLIRLIDTVASPEQVPRRGRVASSPTAYA
jgi:hypothetical protein